MTDGAEIFIPKRFLNGAMHGDEVEANVYYDHGEVKRIISFGVNEISGIYIKDFHGAKVIPDDRRMGRFFKVNGQAQDGERVVIRLSRRSRDRGDIVKRFGIAGELAADIAKEVYSLGIEEFGQKTLEEADEVASEPITTDNRVDFTSQRCFTMDGAGSKDFDDAVYAERTELGYKLWVHIADVGHYVAYKSHLDKQAFMRGNSFYYGEHVIPMLPERLCNDVCSLNENVDRYTLSVALEYDESGFLLGGDIVEGVIRSAKRMTYEDAERALSGEKGIYDEFLPTLETLKELRDLLKRRRDENGNIDFDIAEPEFVFEGETPIGAKKKPRLLTHSIIEECMIAANAFVADFCLSKKLPIVYRVHLAPSEEKLNELNIFLLAFGEKAVPPDSKAIATMLGGLDEEKRGAISRMTLRCMQKAVYSTECKGHFGLAIDRYCHFTSPIRRYSDLVVHRAIKAYLHGEDCSYLASACDKAATQASERERLCAVAERNIDDLYLCHYMSQFIGEEFVGRISGVTEWGIFVELDNTAEGLIRTDDMGYVRFDDRTKTLRGSKRVYKLGDEIKVRLMSASSGNIVFNEV